jgi:hypothetical protein
MQKAGKGMSPNLSLFYQSFYCYEHNQHYPIWLSLAYNDEIFYINRLHIPISKKIRVEFRPTLNQVTLQEQRIIYNKIVPVEDHWTTIAHLPNEPSAWPQSLSYDELIKKIDSFLPFI